MKPILLMVMVGLMAWQDAGQERPTVPDDSIELGVVGCLKGRVLTASDVRQTDVQSGPPVASRSFRLAGKGDLMKEVKRQDGHIVEVFGLVKRSALTRPGVKIGKRVVVGGGSSVASSGRPDPVSNSIVLDISSVRLRGGVCGR